MSTATTYRSGAALRGGSAASRRTAVRRRTGLLSRVWIAVVLGVLLALAIHAHAVLQALAAHTAT